MTLLQLLADGRFRSGEELGAATGVSRASVWKLLREVRALGVDVEAVRGRGYRLARALELLDEASIRTAMTATAAARLPLIEVFPEIDSTNRYLLACAAHPPSPSTKGGMGLTPRACIAERQLAGRGRRGRHWVSPFGANIYLSLLWRFDTRPAALEGVSLAVAVAVVRALGALGITGIGLKWPNDVRWEGRKLAGILLEVSGETTGAVNLVAGIGINMSMPDAVGADIDQPWTDLAQVAGGVSVSRNRLAGLLLQHLVAVLVEFEAHGPGALLGEWANYDELRGRVVELHLPGGVIEGIAVGVDGTGALLLDRAGRVERFFSGEVSVRLQHQA